jgi:hypothetical protein
MLSLIAAKTGAEASQILEMATIGAILLNAAAAFWRAWTGSVVRIG